MLRGSAPSNKLANPSGSIRLHLGYRIPDPILVAVIDPLVDKTLGHLVKFGDLPLLLGQLFGGDGELFGERKGDRW